MNRRTRIYKRMECTNNVMRPSLTLTHSPFFFSLFFATADEKRPREIFAIAHTSLAAQRALIYVCELGVIFTKFICLTVKWISAIAVVYFSRTSIFGWLGMYAYFS